MMGFASFLPVEPKFSFGDKILPKLRFRQIAPGRKSLMPTLSPINESLLDKKLSALEAARSWSPRVISRLETVIRTSDDYDLFRINPIQYATDKGLSEKESIDLFL